MMEILISDLDISTKKQNIKGISDRNKLSKLFISNALNDEIDTIREYIFELEYALNSVTHRIDNPQWIYEFAEHLNKSGRAKTMEYLDLQNSAPDIKNRPKDMAILHMIKAYMYIANGEKSKAGNSFFKLHKFI